ncbi:DUF2332 domain-containing protein [Catellatospora tritici]|uniref:DUF2332 domain-containing protein n=1 Tax=Catellatospora tritici TaxID=2851566 RepID=UPI001C2DE33E|nr:DUF2332 domain-containing protein [Catellatospora tritici]MBV1850814.1 DUF2332 domain-containing protein [Catellatospora tritici]MBV1851067.1 DUF2332 domain-containing protein [Catellatospora tritici]
MQGIPHTDVALADTYRAFATLECAGVSPVYEQLCLGVAADAEVLALIGTLPLPRRQPNLLLGVVRLLGGPIDDYLTMRAWLVAHWDAVRDQMLTRTTQTNEAARTAILLPALADLPQPLALLEVGASAGLCLYPDRYAFAYDGRAPIGDPAGPVIECVTSGPVPVPQAVPPVVWRAGIDLNPLDVTDPDDVAWLRALIWPEHTARRDRLSAAAAIAAADPPLLVRADLNDALPDLVAQAPDDATLVVFHTAVLAYLSPADRDRFCTTMTDLVASRPGTVWLSNEAPGVLPAITGRLPVPVPSGRTVLARDGRPVAFGMPHGQALTWLD